MIQVVIHYYQYDMIRIIDKRLFFLFPLFNRMLDDFGNELDSTDSKIDSTMKKVAKVLHMNNGKRQKCQYTSIL